MHHYRSAFLAFLLLHPVSAYTALFFGMIIEGDLVLFTAGFLAHTGVLHLGPTLIVLLAGTILGDSLWYLLGTTDTDRNKFLNWLGRSVDFAGKKIDAHVQERTFRTLLISKFIYGVHHFVLVRAGRLRVPFKRFFRDDAIGSAIWVLGVTSIGYLASASIGKVRHRFHYIEIILLIGIAVYFVIAEIVGKILRNRL
jgi:membrane protein DedA with SNARE-associated domain